MKGRIIINPIGGLANRMRAIASGISLSQDIGLEYLIIWQCDDTLNAKFEELFENINMLDGKIIYPSNLVYNLKYSIPRKKNLFISKFLLSKFGGYRFDERYYYPSTLNMCENEEDFKTAVQKICESGKDFYISSGLMYYEFEDSLYRQLFNPKEEIKKEAWEIINPERGHHLIGMHIRRTDNKQSISCSPDELFINVAKNELMKSSQNVIYLATDDEIVKRKFKNLFGEKVIVDVAVASRKSLEGMKSAMKELYILSSCEKIYGSYYSSFSEAASLLGDVELEQLIIHQ